MCPSAPRVCSEPGGQKPVLSLSLERISNIPVLFYIMAWHRPGDRPLSEPMIVRLPTHVCITRSQWVNRWEWLAWRRGQICLASQRTCYRKLRTIFDQANFLNHTYIILHSTLNGKLCHLCVLFLQNIQTTSSTSRTRKNSTCIL